MTDNQIILFFCCFWLSLTVMLLLLLLPTTTTTAATQTKKICLCLTMPPRIHLLTFSTIKKYKIKNLSLRRWSHQTLFSLCLVGAFILNLYCYIYFHFYILNIIVFTLLNKNKLSSRQMEVSCLCLLYN